MEAIGESALRSNEGVRTRDTPWRSRLSLKEGDVMFRPPRLSGVAFYELNARPTLVSSEEAVRRMREVANANKETARR